MANVATRLGLNRTSISESTKTAVATTASLLLARAFRMPEFYWAPITTIVILQSSIDPLRGAWQRFVGTALGATLGALIAVYLGRDVVIYALGIFVCGILASALRSWVAYRVAGITMSIVVLVQRDHPAWIVAAHRFLEVSLGIAIALLTAWIWPRREPVSV